MKSIRYGYIRVSSKDQNEERQRIAMAEQHIPVKNLYISMVVLRFAKITLSVSERLVLLKSTSPSF